MITLQNNPMIADPNQQFGIFFAQTRDTLLDTEIYSRFIYSAENRFRKSSFYRDYKSNLMHLGMYRDQRHASITSEMTDIEMHHNFIPLKFMAIMITEHVLNVKGCITTFELVNLLEEAHRENMVSVIMLSKTEHQAHHADPTDFISIKQCAGNPFAFIDKYIDGMTLDISFKLLLHLKQEEQYGESYSPNAIRAREQILSWQQYANNI